MCFVTTRHTFILLTNFSDAENPRFVYEWRQEQERTLRAAKGTGMTEEQVNHFVDGCMHILWRAITPLMTEYTDSNDRYRLPILRALY